MSRLLVGLLLLLFCTITYVHASCKAGEGDPYAPHQSPTQRVWPYSSNDTSQDLSPKSGSVLNILSYNIQSGLSLTCSFDLEAQTALMRSQHFFGLQEVDMFNDLRCMCSQPSVIANLTGHTTLFLNTILYRTGYYGSALASAFDILEIRYHMYLRFSTEERGVLAIRTVPPQLGGRTLWTLNTHLQFDSEFIRLGQTAELVNFTQSIVADYPDALIIVMGDYYVVPGLESYAVLEAYFMNAWATFHGAPDGGWTYPSDFPSNRFDHVWFKFPAGTTYNLSVEVINIRLSDHRPLQVYFDFGATTIPPTPLPATPKPTPTPKPTATPTPKPTSVPTTIPTPVPPTQSPPTQSPPTQSPPTQSPPTQSPPTSPPPTSAPPTIPPTVAPTTPPTTPPTVNPTPAPTGTPPVGDSLATATSAAATAASIAGTVALTASVAHATADTATTTTAAATSTSDNTATTTANAAATSDAAAATTSNAAATSTAANVAATSTAANAAATSVNAASTSANAASVAAATSAAAAGSTSAAAAAAAATSASATAANSATTNAAATAANAASTSAAASVTTGTIGNDKGSTSSDVQGTPPPAGTTSVAVGPSSSSESDAATSSAFKTVHIPAALLFATIALFYL